VRHQRVIGKFVLAHFSLVAPVLSAGTLSSGRTRSLTFGTLVWRPS